MQKKQAQNFWLSFFAARSTIFIVNLAREQKSLAIPALLLTYTFH
jgi:hypothetical protein